MMKILLSVVAGMMTILYIIGAFVTVAALKEICHIICHEN